MKQKILSSVILLLLLAAGCLLGTRQFTHGRPVPADHILIVVMCLLAPLVDAALYPRFVQACKNGKSGVRLRFYMTGIATAWIFTACVVGLWLTAGRPWKWLGLGSPNTITLPVGLAVAGAYVFLALKQRKVILARPEAADMLREALGSSDALLPRTASERTGFVFVSLTAGICEEFLYRGFVLWYFSSQLGTFAGAVAATLLFGFAHVYLGWNHVFRTARIGVIFMLVVLSCGSLIPAMIMHAVMDLVAGDLGYRLNSGELEQGSAPVSGA